jgi:hypothetical protein
MKRASAWVAEALYQPVRVVSPMVFNPLFVKANAYLGIEAPCQRDAFNMGHRQLPGDKELIFFLLLRERHADIRLCRLPQRVNVQELKR